MKEYKFKIGGKEYNVTVNPKEGKLFDVTVNGTTYEGLPPGDRGRGRERDQRDRHLR